MSDQQPSMVAEGGLTPSQQGAQEGAVRDSTPVTAGGTSSESTRESAAPTPATSAAVADAAPVTAPPSVAAPVSGASNGATSSDHSGSDPGPSLAHGMSRSCLPPIRERLELFTLYETRTKFYLVGSTMAATTFRILKIDRLHADYSDLFGANTHAISEDYLTYDKENLKDLLTMIDLGNASNGGLKEVVSHCYGIIGFVRFQQGYHMVLATNRKLVGKIGGHLIYEVSDTTMIAITHPAVYASQIAQGTQVCTAEVPFTATTASRIKTNEAKYKSLFQGLDLNKGFFFCTTGYDLTHTLQSNMLEAGRRRAAPPPVKSTFLWNNFLLGGFYRSMQRTRDEEERDDAGDEPHDEEGAPPVKDDEESPHSDASFPWSPTSSTAHLNPAASWGLNLIHGFFVQTHLSSFGNIIDLALLARRSRFFAGTRYLKRGVNNLGQVANDIEIEQILGARVSLAGSHLEGHYSSYVQTRASIPLHWSQESSAVVVQPLIVVNKTDPLHLATRLHVEDLWSRYGSPLLCLNLVKHETAAVRKRESIIGDAFGCAVEFMNRNIPAEEHKIDYLAWDFKRVSQSKTHSVVDELGVISQWGVQRTGVFNSRPHPEAFPTSAASTTAVKPNRDSIRRYVNMEGGGGAASALAEFSSPLFAHTGSSVSKPEFARLRSKHYFNLASHLAAHAATTEHVPSVPRLLFKDSPAKLPYPLPSFPVQHISFLQRGVVRTNCIDSLDRTNVAQFCIGKCALGYQLFALGVIDSVHLASGGTSAVADQSLASASSEIVNILLDLYETMGDELAQQYGGSAMHRSIKTDRSKDGKNTLTLSQNKSGSQPSEVFVSIKRHFQNSFQDTSKQDAINLFLGYFSPPEVERLGAVAMFKQPVETPASTPASVSITTDTATTSLHKSFTYPHVTHTQQMLAVAMQTTCPHVWDLSSDFYLHNPRHLNAVHRLQEVAIKKAQRAAAVQKRLEAAGTPVAPDSAASESLIPAPRGGCLLEVGHCIYPNSSWWMDPIAQFERTLEGYLPDWLMSFPELTAAQRLSEAEVTPVNPTASDPAIVTSTPSLSSFDEMLSPEQYKVRSVRIMGGPIVTAPRGSYSSLVPRFLWRRNKAGDEELDGVEEAEEEAATLPIMERQSTIDFTHEFASSLPPQSELSTSLPRSWLDPSQRHFGPDGAASQLPAPTGEYTTRLDTQNAATLPTTPSIYATAVSAPGMIALAGGVGSTSGNASHFAAPGLVVKVLSPAQQVTAATTALATEYLHLPYGRVQQTDGSFIVPSATFATPNERKLHHYLDHYANIRVEHNLIIEPQATKAPMPSAPHLPQTPAKKMPQHAAPLPPISPSPTDKPVGETPSIPSPVAATFGTPPPPSTALDFPLSPTPFAPQPNNGGLMSPSSSSPTFGAIASPRALSAAPALPARPALPVRNASPGVASASGPPLVFSHAPPNSSISIRNGKKAAFYAAYLRRGDYDAEFVASTFEVERLVGSAPIIVDQQADLHNEAVYRRYLDAIALDA